MATCDSAFELVAAAILDAYLELRDVRAAVSAKPH